MKIQLKNHESINLPKAFDIRLNHQGSGFYLVFHDRSCWVGDDYDFDAIKNVVMDMLKSHFRTHERIIAYLLTS